MTIAKTKTESFQCIVMALWAQRLHAQNICQFNHSLSFCSGWFQFDDQRPFRDTGLTDEARRLMALGCKGAWEWVRMSTVYHIVES